MSPESSQWDVRLVAVSRSLVDQPLVDKLHTTYYETRDLSWERRRDGTVSKRGVVVTTVLC